MMTSSPSIAGGHWGRCLIEAQQAELQGGTAIWLRTQQQQRNRSALILQARTKYPTLQSPEWFKVPYCCCTASHLCESITSDSCREEHKSHGHNAGKTKKARTQLHASQDRFADENAEVPVVKTEPIVEGKNNGAEQQTTGVKAIRSLWEQRSLLQASKGPM